MSASLSPAALRLLAQVPRWGPITLRRAAHVAPLTTYRAVDAAVELIKRGLVEQPETSPRTHLNALLIRTAGGRALMEGTPA